MKSVGDICYLGGSHCGPDVRMRRWTNENKLIFSQGLMTVSWSSTCSMLVSLYICYILDTLGTDMTYNYLALA